MFVGVLAWMWGLRSEVADLREEGYEKHPIGGWLSDMGEGGMGGGGGV